jgi:hypothetical protein
MGKEDDQNKRLEDIAVASTIGVAHIEKWCGTYMLVMRTTFTMCSG